MSKLQWPSAWGRIMGPVAWIISHKPRVKPYTWCKDQCHHAHKVLLLPWHWQLHLRLLYQDMNDLSSDFVFVYCCAVYCCMKEFRNKWVGLENVTGDSYLHADYAVFPKYTSTLPFFLIYTLYTHHRLNFPILVLLFMLELLTSTESLKKQNSFFWYWT